MANTPQPIQFDNIPPELRQLPHWVRWKIEPRVEGESPSKIPYRPCGTWRAKSNEPTTWGAFDLAQQWLAHGDMLGIGFCFADNGGLVGIDLDGCRDPVTGAIAIWASELLTRFASTYAEISPSQKGIKICCRGRLPTDRTGKRVKLPGNHCGIEAYHRGRFFTVTGQLVAGHPSAVADCQDAIDWLWSTWIKPNEPERQSAKVDIAKLTAISGDRLTIVKRASAYMAKIPPAVQGQNGSGQTFRAACELFRFGLTDSEAKAVFAEFNGRCEPAWSESELDHKLEDARDEVQDSGEFGVKLVQEPRNGNGKPHNSKPSRNGNGKPHIVATEEAGAAEALIIEQVITNATVEYVEDEDGKERRITEPLPMTDVLKRIREQTGDWPRRVGQSLFAWSTGGVNWLGSTSAAFGWLQSRVGVIRWHSSNVLGCVSREEVFAELRRTSTAYAAVQSLPHEPEFPGHYYATEPIEPGDGTVFLDLLSRFRPATEIDGDLIRAAFLTPMWGGPPGCRPCFVITSDDGRGAGKSTLAELIGELYGGILQFAHHEDVGTIKTRLLSNEAITRRVALLDNIKTMKFSWAELEGMITAGSIGGHKLYEGEATRPNLLTWFITLNGAALSCDMAQRSVVIKLNKPPRSADWLDGIREFIRQHQHQILGDIIGALRGPIFSLAKFTRWATWERDILQRLPDPAGAQRTIMERQSVVDVDGEEAGIIEEFFTDQLGRLDYDVNRERIFIPSQIAARWLNWAVNEKHSVISASRMLTQMASEGRLKRVQPKLGRSQGGRGFEWIGNGVDVMTLTSVDILERMARRKSEVRGES